jgi:ureidoacrylate peracid hydrolase
MIYKIKPALVIIDMQNGFMSSDGAFDKLGFNISNYQKIVPAVKVSYRKAKSLRLPVFLSQAIREKSGIDMLERQHNILPDKRRERIETLPLCIRDTWDSDFIDTLQPEDSDYVVQKRRDSIFQDTEFGLWLRSLKVDTIIFTGIDTSICVESSLRDAFNRGWDVILLSDATASLNDNFYQTTIIETEENFGLVMKSSDLFNNLKKFGANLFLLNVKNEK